MSLKQVLVFCVVLVGLLALGQARRHHRGGRRHGGLRLPRGPICKITDGTGSRLYEDPDKCVLNGQCTQGTLPNMTCADNVEANFWFCSPKHHFLRGACVVDGRDYRRNCTCGETVYTIALSSQPDEQISVRYCQDRPRRNFRRQRPTQYEADDDNDDDDDEEEEWSHPALLGQFYNNFNINTCQRSGRPGRQDRPGRPGRQGGRNGGRRRWNGRPE